MKEYLLLTPGPTNVPKRILEKTAIPMIHHRTKEFQAILERVNFNLQKVFFTQAPVMTFAASGTGAMEASISNLLSRGDLVISFSAGKWGERFRDIAKAYGLDVKSYETPYGEAISAEQVRQALKQHSSAKAVLVTLCETSTAVTHPIREIAAVTQGSSALLMVDAVSGLMCDPLLMDEWGVDVVVCGSQKGLMLPPGLAFAALNERATQALLRSNLPKFYFNFTETLKAIKKNDTPFTPGISLIVGLAHALRRIQAEGLDRIVARHQAQAQAICQAVKALGLELYTDSACASNAVTAVKVPSGIDGKDLLKRLRQSHGIILAGGQGKELAGKIFRIASMGAIDRQEIQLGLTALEKVLNEMGWKGNG